MLSVLQAEHRAKRKQHSKATEIGAESILDVRDVHAFHLEDSEQSIP